MPPLLGVRPPWFTAPIGARPWCVYLDNDGTTETISPGDTSLPFLFDSVGMIEVPTGFVAVVTDAWCSVATLTGAPLVAFSGWSFRIEVGAAIVVPRWPLSVSATASPLVLTVQTAAWQVSPPIRVPIIVEAGNGGRIVMVNPGALLGAQFYMGAAGWILPVTNDVDGGASLIAESQRPRFG